MKNRENKPRIGLLGGTFNPVHIGHLMLAQNAMNWCDLEKVIFIPAGISYFKSPDEVESAKHRLKMSELAIMDNDSFELSTIETDRAGNSYTYETLEILTKENPDVCYYYIIGADTLFKIDTWKYPEKIFDKCVICCAKRDYYSNIEMEARKKYLEDKFGAVIEIMDIPEVQISSTFIRNSIKDGNKIRYYLNDDVLKYISDNKLYLSD